MSINNQYRFYLTDPDGAEHQLTPINDDLVFSSKKEDKQVFYRRKLDTSLVFRNQDYSTIKTIEEGANRNTRMNLSIKHLESGVENDFFDGYVCLDRGTFNFSRCQIELPVDNDDGYTCLYDSWEDEFNIFTAFGRRTVKTFFGETEEITKVKNDVPSQSRLPISEFESLGILEEDQWSFYRYDVSVTATVGIYRHFVTFIRLRAEMPCEDGDPVNPPGDGWVLDEDNCPTGAVFIKNLPTVYRPDLSDLTDSGFKSYIYTYAAEGYIEFDNGVPLSTILSSFLGSCPYKVVSDFFGIGGDGSNPDNIAYQSALEKLQNVVIFQKSDIKRPDAAQNATRGIWTYKELLEVLRQLFQVYAVVYPDTFTIRFEHISYWQGTTTSTVDTTVYNSTAGRYIYSYDTNELIKFETLEYGEEVSDEFAGSAITYPDSCTTEERQSNDETVTDVNCDVNFILNNQDLVSDQGFVIVPTIEYEGDYYMFDEYNAEFGTLDFNGHMSVPNLFDKYWRHNRPFIQGVMNGADEAFLSSRKTKIQEAIDFVIPPESFASLNESAFYKTEVSEEGEIINLTWSVKTRQLTINTAHV